MQVLSTSIYVDYLDYGLIWNKSTSSQASTLLDRHHLAAVRRKSQDGQYTTNGYPRLHSTLLLLVPPSSLWQTLAMAAHHLT